MQIIVVDDNSDEGKRPDLAERNGLEIVLLETFQSKGAGRARNVGLKYAKGKWLLFADADDHYVDGFLDVLDEYKDETIDVLYFSFEYRDGKTSEHLPELPFKAYIDRYDGSTLAQELIKYKIKVPWTKMVSRNFVQQNNISFEETINGNDIFFSMCVGFYAKAIEVDKRTIYVYLKNENSLVNAKKKNAEKHLCGIKHNIQLDYFYDYIGHANWRLPVIRNIISHIGVYGIGLLWPLLIHSRDLVASRKRWVLYFKNNQR